MRFTTLLLCTIVLNGLTTCNKNKEKTSAIQQDTYTDTINRSDSVSQDIVQPEDNTKVEDTVGKSLYYGGD